MLAAVDPGPSGHGVSHAPGMARSAAARLRTSARDLRIARYRRKLERRSSHVSIASDVSISRSAAIDISGEADRLVLGPRTQLTAGVVLAPMLGSIVLDENVYVGPYAVLYGPGGLYIGKRVLIGPHVTIVAGNHRFDDASTPYIAGQGSEGLGIHIGDGCWIGSGAVICDGVTVGEGAVVGAGAVVTRDVEPMTVVVGSPARFLRRRGETAPPKT